MGIDPAPADSFAERLTAFMEEHIYPHEAAFHREIEQGDRWAPIAITETLKTRARETGLWNLFLPEDGSGRGLSNAKYAPLCEIMGRSPAFAPEVFNCSAPDTGNMETLARFGTDDQRRQWLEPLLRGDIRSCFAMTEPTVASSDPTNITSTIARDGNDYVINGRKWFITGAGDPRCKVALFWGKTSEAAPRHQQHSIVLVPMDSQGLRIVRMLSVFGYDDAPQGHGELVFENVRVPVSNMILGEGRGFEIAQARLGPGRVHHCMRLIGLAERSLEAMCRRVRARVAFGKPLADQGTIRADIAESRMAIEQARLLVMNAARTIDLKGGKGARAEIAMIKVVVPRMASAVIDRAMQAHGAAGLSADLPLARAWAYARTIRLADGPDEVHRETIAKLELKKSETAAVPTILPGGAQS